MAALARAGVAVKLTYRLCDPNVMQAGAVAIVLRFMVCYRPSMEGTVLR